MKRLVAVACAFALCAGCGPKELTQRAALYEAGQDMLLAYRAEMRSQTTSASESWTYSTDGKRRLVRGEERKYSGVTWLGRDVYIHPRATGDPARLQVRMRVQRQHAGGTYRDEEGHSKEEGYDTAHPANGDADEYKEPLERFAQLRKCSFLAVWNLSERAIESFDANGPLFAELKKQWDDPQVTDEQKAAALRMQSQGVFSAFAEAAAYLPPSDAQPGVRWTVRRNRVYPHHAYAFYMHTNGCYFASEQSVCTVESVRQTPRGREIMVTIRGRRHPLEWSSSMPQRVNYMELTGELRFNETTQEVLSLRVEARPVFLSAEDRRMFHLTFVDTARLTRLDTPQSPPNRKKPSTGQAD